jgi:deoxyribose-phosphate aldolase
MTLPDLSKTPKIDKVGVQERTNRFCARSIKTSAKQMGLYLALSMIDLTTLEGKDTPEKVKQLCYKAQHLHDSIQNLPHVAAVCVYPTDRKSVV